MMGAHEATVLEMDRVESSRGESDLWKLITAAEYWERQNKALLSLPDSDEPKESLGPPDRPKPHAVDAQTLAADVECGWCSKIGHSESSCQRQNLLCGKCGGEHPSRRHQEVVKREEKMREPTGHRLQVQVATPHAPMLAGAVRPVWCGWCMKIGHYEW